MVKSLRHWKNRKTTLQIGDKSYSGKVVREYIAPRRSSQTKYYFQSDKDGLIVIGKKRVICIDGGLVLKINPIAMIH